MRRHKPINQQEFHVSSVTGTLIHLSLIPLGAADIVKLFKHLKAGGDRASETDETR